MEILPHIFYLLLLIPLLYEFLMLVDTKEGLRIWNNGINNKNTEDNQVYKFMSNLMIIYTVLCFIGLFSSSWLLFLILIIIGMVTTTFKNKNYIITKIDSFICFCILLFIILNKFHFHFNLNPFL